MQLTVVINADNVTGDGISHANAIIRHKSQRIGNLHFPIFS